MKPFIANLINAIALIVIGLWGYFGSETPSLTAFIPVIGGIILLAFHQGLKKENRVASHIVVVLTLILLIGLVKPLTGAIGRHNLAAVLRVSVMLLTGIWAMAAFINSFITVRRNRKKKVTAEQD